MKRPPWTKFEIATESTISPVMVDAMLKHQLDSSLHAVGLGSKDAIYVNSRYQVALRDMADGALKVLSIKRRDKMPIHDWRDFQRIKNELCGDEWLGIEVYPPESELMDTANQYWMWCFKPGAIDWPFMFRGRRIVSEDETGGVRQRQWDSDNRPTDLLTLDEICAIAQNAKVKGRA